MIMAAALASLHPRVLHWGVREAGRRASGPQPPSISGTPQVTTFTACSYVSLFLLLLSFPFSSFLYFLSPSFLFPNKYVLKKWWEVQCGTGSGQNTGASVGGQEGAGRHESRAHPAQPPTTETPRGPRRS